MNRKRPAELIHLGRAKRHIANRRDGFARRHPRDGYVLVAVLVAATVALGVSMASLRGTSTAIQRNRLQWQRAQLDRLVEATTWRAKQSIRQDRSITAETWTVSGEALSGSNETSSGAREASSGAREALSGAREALSGNGNALISMQVNRDADPPRVMLSIQWNHPDGKIVRETTFPFDSLQTTDPPQREEL